MPAFYLRPGVFPREIDLSERVAAISTSVGAAVFGSKKGPMKPTLITNKQQFLDLYGKPDVSWGDYGHHSCLAFLVNGRALWAQRVVNEARYAGMRVVNNKDGGAGDATYFVPFPTGPLKDYETGGQQYQHIIFSGPLVASNTVTVTLKQGVTEVTVEQQLTGGLTHDGVLAALAEKITKAMNDQWAANYEDDDDLTPLKNIGHAGVITVGSTATDDRIIRVVSPEGQLIDIEIAITGSTPPFAYVAKRPWLFEIYAENPGAWGNDVGIKLVNVDQGVKQRRKIAFTGTFVAGNGPKFQAAIMLKNKRVTVNTVIMATDDTHNMMMEKIADALLNALGGRGVGADVEIVRTAPTVGNDNLVEIILTAPEDGPDVFNIVDIAITATSGSPPTAVVTETRAGIAKSDVFELWVYTRDNITTPVEKHVVSFKEQVDGFGNQQFIEEVINNSASRSAYIRVRYNNEDTSGSLNNILSDMSVQWLNGGSDGIKATSANIVTAWDNFDDRARYDVRILINCGYTSQSVHNKMVQIAEKRRDCFAILDVPMASQNTQNALEWRANSSPNSSYAAAYAPYIKIMDEFTNRTISVPPSGYIAAVFAFTDAVAAEWFAPAGLNRGLVKNIISLTKEYSTADEELLFPKQINCIVKRPGKGYPIMGAETTQSKASALSNINVRRMLITIEVSLVDALDYTVYEPNDSYTQFQVVQLCNNFLDPIKTGRGLYDYKVISDDSNNKPYHKDAGQLNVDILMKPVIPVKFIRLSSIITRTGASFDEIIGMLNG